MVGIPPKLTESLILEGLQEIEELKTQYELLNEKMQQDRGIIDKGIKMIIEQKDSLHEQSKKLDRQEAEIKTQKADLIQYFGLFVAIFTVISIDIQLLQFGQNVWQIAGLMLIINTAPLLFFYFIRSMSNQKISLWKFALIFLTMFICGSGLMYFGECRKNECLANRLSRIVIQKIGGDTISGEVIPIGTTSSVMALDKRKEGS